MREEAVARSNRVFAAHRLVVRHEHKCFRILLELKNSCNSEVIGCLALKYAKAHESLTAARADLRVAREDELDNAAPEELSAIMDFLYIDQAEFLRRQRFYGVKV